jgi:ribosomal protein S18 acetylase RimI-like enzyme
MANIKIRRLDENAIIPYHLLLLADPYKNAIEKYLNSSEIYVAVLENEVVGVYVLYPITRNTIEIKNIAVEESYQGCGIGKLMLINAAKISKEKNYATIIIGTGNSSIGQLSLYQKQGFEIFDIKKNFFVENYIVPIFEDGIQCKHMIMLSKKL